MIPVARPVAARNRCAAAAIAVLTGLVSPAGRSQPADDQLLIDGAIDMITRTESIDGHPLPEVISGWHYRSEDTRLLEQDTFDNPGMLGVETGAEIWSTVEGSAERSCLSCHDDAEQSMAGVGARYPAWDAASGKPVNIEQRIDQCRVQHMGADPYPFDDAAQKALTAFIKHQSLGTPVTVNLAEGDMQRWWDAGKAHYYQRYGQLDFSCATCHEKYNGRHMRADHLSQGNVNGFPTYRLKQSDLVSLHNRFRGCIRDTRAEIPAAFSDELIALEVYTTWRSSGLSVETPAVRQ